MNRKSGILSSILNRIFRPKDRGKVWRTVIGILVLFFFSAFLTAPKPWNDGVAWINAKAPVNLPAYWDIPFRLGLDLQGGTHLVYEADTSGIPENERAEALEGVRDVIERRVNAFGVAEPVVQTNRSGGKWRIIVELAGVSDVNEAIRMIGETPILEFKEEKVVEDITLTEEQEAELAAGNEEAKGLAEGFADRIALENPEDIAAFATENDDDADRFDVVGQKLGLVSNEGLFAPFWEWANANPNATVSAEPIENDEGYNVLRVLDRDESGKDVRASHILVCFEGSQGCEGGPSKEDALTDILAIRESLTPENFAEQAKIHSSDPSAEQNGGDLGYFGPGAMVPAFEEAAFALQVGEISSPVESDFGWHLIWKQDERNLVRYEMERLVVTKLSPIDVAPQLDPWKNTELSGKHLERSQVQFTQQTNEPEVVLYFNEEGEELFADLTEANVGKLIGIFLDGEPITVPRVNQRISGGQAVITGQFDIQEAKLLAQRLNAGALPVPIDLLSQQTVGASLGQDSLQKSVQAGLIGFLIVVLFMIAYYRLPGVLASLALIMYAAFTLAVFKLLGVTLTLSGIAGFILSVGMAVDANILIFERMKEELANGRPLDGAMKEGFERAWTSIRDSNVSSLITAGILYSFTSSAVRGFALTLAIGILISMFSAIYVTKSLLKLVMPWTKKHLWLYR